MPDNSSPKIIVRMFRQGLGDCHLITFLTGAQPVHMLIDCGSLGSTTRPVKLGDVVAKIQEETGKHLDLLVATHEHWDHVSGFKSQKDSFDEFQVDNVWVAWTEDPKDECAQEVAKFKQDLVTAVRLAGEALQSNNAVNPQDREDLTEMASGMRELLGFYGELPADGAPLGAKFGESVQEAMTYVTRRTGKTPEYLKPGQVIEPEWLPGVRFYVFGPPRSPAALTNLGTHESEELYHLTGRTSTDLVRQLEFHASGQTMQAYRSAMTEGAEQEQLDADRPFDLSFRIEEGDQGMRQRFLSAYDDPAEAWRRIDHDWLNGADELALQLDNATNNTSLVLAIELIGDGRVLLFPADAQLGNWLSWQDVKFEVKEGGTTRTINVNELLARTVFYKVGHHSSHNATINKNGLEAMTREDLVAFIPVDRKVALNKHPVWDMPAKPLYMRLLAKTGGRVLRSDIGFPSLEEEKPVVQEAEWDHAWDAAQNDKSISVEDLYIEYRLT